MTKLAIRPSTHALCALVTCALLTACKPPAPPDPGPDLQIVSETLRLRVGDPVPRSSPFFDGTTVHLVAARGEALAFQVLHRGGGTAALHVTGEDLHVRGYDVASAIVRRASTAGIYGASHGTGAYPDVLRANDAPVTSPALFEVEVARDAAPGTRHGELVVGDRTLPVELQIADVVLPSPAGHVWAYYDPRELAWAKLGAGTIEAPSEHERRCIATFRRYGVVLSVDLTPAAWPARAPLLGDLPFVPVRLPTDPDAAAADVRAWIDATRGSGKLPFAIPIDEPRRPDARAKVRTLATAVRDAGGGPRSFLYAVTAKPHADFTDLIDLYITLEAKRADTFPRWTYNGAPPRAGSLILDGPSPGPRTWGWIGWRWRIPVWYVWDALYWHDRHNRHGAPLPGRDFDIARDSISFDDGEDHGNLDGVLALPGDDEQPCRPTLRLAAIRRGMQDRALIEAAARCNATATDALVAQLVPRALGDAPLRGKPAWPTDDAAWEQARRQLLSIAACGATRR